MPKGKDRSCGKNDGVLFRWDACTETTVERKLRMQNNERAAGTKKEPVTCNTTLPDISELVQLSEPATAVAERSTELKAEARNVNKQSPAHSDREPSDASVQMTTLTHRQEESRNQVSYHVHPHPLVLVNLMKMK